MGAPGWPETAFCTASIARVRMVLMHSQSRGVNSDWAWVAAAMVGPGFDGWGTGGRRFRRALVEIWEAAAHGTRPAHRGRVVPGLTRQTLGKPGLARPGRRKSYEMPDIFALPGGFR